MARLLAATALLVAASAVHPGAVSQDPASAPVTLSTPDSGSRSPVSRPPAPPGRPVKLDVPPDPVAEPRTPDDGPSAEAQRRGGGGGGRSAGGRSAGVRPAGGGARPGRWFPAAGPRGPWPGWGSPVYFTRPYYYDPFWTSGAFGWSPLFYAPWPLMWGTVGYWPGPWSGPQTTLMTGGVRLKIKPRQAEVIVNGYYAGIVDEFDGVFQSLRLAPGGHKIEVRLAGYETRTFDVHVQPNRTMTITEVMQATP